MRSKNKKILIVIPARLASSRFPNKPMKKIYGIPMIGHCYIRSIKSKLSSDCFVATPDLEIFNYIKLIRKLYRLVGLINKTYLIS